MCRKGLGCVQAEGRSTRLDGSEQAGTWREGAQLHLTKNPKAAERRTIAGDPCPCGLGGVVAEVCADLQGLGR